MNNFESKYANVLTIILVVVIIAILVLLGIFGYNIYKDKKIDDNRTTSYKWIW